MKQSDRIVKLKKMINESHNMVFLGGAGVSTESGIPDFRSKDGLFHQEYQYPPEEILSYEFYQQHKEEFYRFYTKFMLHPDVLPNKAHEKLAEWEAEGRLKAIITQNIDGLHQKAGNKNVLELHGSVMRNYCSGCHAFYDMEEMLQFEGIPVCRECGEVIKPDVVLYGENLNTELLAKAVDEIGNADMLIVGGTSLAVYPAANLIRSFYGDHLIVVNKTRTPIDGRADLMIQGNIGEIFAYL